MIDLVEAIRIAMEPDAPVEARTAGASACRTILETLEPATVQESGPPPLDPAQIAGLVTTLRGVPVDQLLDLAIAKMRAALPAGTAVPHAQQLHFRLIPTSHLDVLAKKTP